MGDDHAGARLRERIWVTKFDHTVDPPRPIEEVFIENGVVMSVTPLSPDTDDADTPAVLG